jgi:phage-related baseplate assembly protein
MAGYTAVDLSRLPAPDVVEALDYETIFEALLADLIARDPVFTALLESDPTYIALQSAAYRELNLRQRVNDAAKAVMLAYAQGADLDNLGALLGVPRLQLDPGDPSKSIPPTMESDTDYRRRITLAPEGFSVAGPEGAYIYHAVSASPDVLDASASSPEPDDIRALVLQVLADHSADPALVTAMTTALDSAVWPGDVTVSVLARSGDGTAQPDLLATVGAALSAETVRPLTDHVTVQSASIVPYQVIGTRYTYAGPDASVVLAASDAALQAYIDEAHRLGRDIPLSALYAALHVDGIQRVELTSPAADIVISATQAAHCTAIDLTYGGTDD